MRLIIISGNNQTYYYFRISEKSELTYSFSQELPQYSSNQNITYGNSSHGEIFFLQQ